MKSTKSKKDNVQIYESAIFKRKRKKLKRNEIEDLNIAIKLIIQNPKIGQIKTGDLSNVWVYKFKMAKQENLLAYKWDEKKRMLIALGVHENFYRDIKKSGSQVN